MTHLIEVSCARTCMDYPQALPPLLPPHLTFGLPVFSSVLCRWRRAALPPLPQASRSSLQLLLLLLAMAALVPPLDWLCNPALLVLAQWQSMEKEIIRKRRKP